MRNILPKNVNIKENSTNEDLKIQNFFPKILPKTNKIVKVEKNIIQTLVPEKLSPQKFPILMPKQQNISETKTQMLSLLDQHLKK